MKEWFTINQIDTATYIISEYRHWEETHCYLLNGSRRSLLIGTGLGISNIYNEAVKLTDKPIAAAATHFHWDHIGGHQYFPEFYAHGQEVSWLNGEFPLPLHRSGRLFVFPGKSFRASGEKSVSGTSYTGDRTGNYR